jgi:curved DNA-binding protein CbpA
MEAKSFVNYYEVLELSPGASFGAIERNFRDLARRYHPDNQATGDRLRFDLIVDAHNVLRDPIKRDRYDLDHRQVFPDASKAFKEEAGPNDAAADAVRDDQAQDEAEKARDGLGIDRDIAIQNGLLMALYLRRRKNIRDPGLGDTELERLTGCSPEHLEFHLWYLKEKGWIAVGDDGLFMITIDGVDRAALIHQNDAARRLITDQS